MKKLFWLDMEMSGLDINKEVIIEVAAIITDLNFKELDTFEAIVKQPQHFLDNMDAWNTEHHGKSGLTAKVPHGMEPTAAEHHLVSLAKNTFLIPEINLSWLATLFLKIDCLLISILKTFLRFCITEFLMSLLGKF